MRFDENFNVSLSLNPKREMIKVMKKYLLVSLLALLAFVGKAQEDNSDIVKVGDTMPSFTIVSDNGSKLQSASLKGKVILVNFFATWSHNFGTLWVCGWSVRYRVISWNGRDVTTL